MAQTIDSVKLNADEWLQITAAEGYLLQIIRGQAGIIIDAAQPGADVLPGQKGHLLYAAPNSNLNDLTNSKGGTAWGRAMSGPCSKAVIAVTVFK